jgi:uracil-DNA glycosylase family 4
MSSQATVLEQAVLACRACPRLRAWRERNAELFPDYHNSPVPAWGRAKAPLLILGLAPGLHGANRTGVPFTGDGSGDLLFAAMQGCDLRSGDTLAPCVRISNAVKCWPPENKPRPSEVRLCQRFLRQELASARVVMALGRVAHEAVLKALDQPLKEYRFAHGARHRLDALTLYNSYHCSRYNQNTGRINRAMLEDVLKLAQRELSTL